MITDKELKVTFNTLCKILMRISKDDNISLIEKVWKMGDLQTVIGMVKKEKI